MWNENLKNVFYVHLCCSTGDIVIIQKKFKKTPSRIEKSMCTPGVFYVHCFFKSGRCPKTVFQFYILCSGTSLYIKRMEFEVPKRLSPRVAKFQAIIALTNV